MTDERPMEEVCNLWTNQPAEAAPLAIESLERRASAVQGAIAMRNLREYLAGAVVIVIFGWYAFDASFWVVQLAAVTVIAGCAYTMLELHRRAAREAIEPADPAVSCVAFHCAALERQRAALHDVWKWYLAPLVPGIVLFALAVALERPGAWMAASVTLALCAGVFYGIHRLNRRAAAELQREIESLRQPGHSTRSEE